MEEWLSGLREETFTEVESLINKRSGVISESNADSVDSVITTRMNKKFSPSNFDAFPRNTDVRIYQRINFEAGCICLCIEYDDFMPLETIFYCLYFQKDLLFAMFSHWILRKYLR